MFNVGDRVRSKKDARGGEYYSITHSGVVCTVLEVDGEVIRVQPEYSRASFHVRSKHFSLEQPLSLENK